MLCAILIIVFSILGIFVILISEKPDNKKIVNFFFVVLIQNNEENDLLSGKYMDEPFIEIKKTISLNA